MEALWQDLSHSARSLLKAPGFTTVAVLTLGLGVGANSAIFSVLDGVVLRPLAIPGAKHVVNLGWDGRDYLQANVSALKLQYWREHTSTFDAMATWRVSTTSLGESNQTTAIRALHADSGLLDVLGFAPHRGRYFEPPEGEPEGPRLAVVSYGFWTSRLGAADDLASSTLRLDGEVHSIIGVLPREFTFPYENDPVEVVLPLGLEVDPTSVAQDWPIIARLRAGVSATEAAVEVTSLAAAFRGTYPDQVGDGDRGMVLASFAELYVRDGARPLWILMGAVTIVLLIACANVANLFLARAETRRAEVVVRAALGATRGRILGLVFAESVLIAGLASVVGLALAGWAVGTLTGLSPTDLPRMAGVGLDLRVLVFTLSAAAGTALIFGCVAAWPAFQLGLSSVLKETRRGHIGGRRRRQGLLVAQSALAMVLLVSATLLVVTLFELSRVDPGFDADALVAVRFPIKPDSYQNSEDFWELERQAVDRAASLSTIVSIAGASSLPLERGVNTPVSIDGSDEFSTVEWRAVSPGYFTTMAIERLVGRLFGSSDTRGSRRVAIINESLATRFFPRGNAIGQRVSIGRPRTGAAAPEVVEVVGVVADIREASLRSEPRRTLYVSQAQASDRLSLLRGTMPVFIARMRTPGVNLTALSGELGDALRVIDPALPGADVFPLGSVLAASLARERFGASLLTILAALALVLTAVGIYGVQTYWVRQRHREIGIRMALGAADRQVSRMVVAQGMAPVGLGVLLGALVCVVLVRVGRAYIWGVGATDPETYAGAAAILLGVAVLSSWLPARYAAGLHPVEMLRSD